MHSSNFNILLVEDDPNDVFLIQRAFTKANMSSPIQTVSDGEQAMAYLSGEGQFQDRARFPLPGLILLDLKLPRKSGLEVLTWIRAQPGSVRRVPVIMLTSSRQSSDVNRAYDLGANSYLVKPVAFEGLLQVVQTVDLYWIALNEKPEV
jgi:DNA-binding response OmpR family regulator